MSTEKFCLKWNDFTTNVLNSVSRLRNETKMFDVTLMGNDQKPVSAHKLVLSACSEFFKNIFSDISGNNNLILYLDGVDAHGIHLMLDYIYQGEVQIYQEHLDGFLEMAKKFKLDGLLASENEEETDMRSHGVQDQNINYTAPDIQRDVKERSLKPHGESIESSYSEVEEKFQDLIVIGDKFFRCTVCGKTMTHRSSMKRHLETHLTGLSFDCNQCGKTFRLRNTLSHHKSVFHSSR